MLVGAVHITSLRAVHLAVASEGCLFKGSALPAGIMAAALLALWDLAADRCSDAGSWCMQAFSGSRTSSSALSMNDASGHYCYQAVPDDTPAEYWVRSFLHQPGCISLLAMLLSMPAVEYRRRDIAA